MIWQHIIVFILFLSAIALMVWPFLRKDNNDAACGGGCKGCSSIDIGATVKES